MFYRLTKTRSTLVLLAIFFMSVIFPHHALADKSIVFVSTRDGNANIYVMEPDGSSQTRLTDSIDAEYSPAWSPDGSRIAFIRGGSGSLSIVIMNADGSGQIPIFPLQGLSTLNWSPDGKRLLFSDSSGFITSIRTDGSDKVFHSPFDHEGYSPTWSPDGSRIAFHSWGTGSLGYSDVFTMKADGSDIKNLNVTLEYGSPTEPSWSPDGTRIVFLGTTEALAPDGLAVANADGSNFLDLIPYDESIQCPKFSPDSQGFIFDRASGTSRDIWTLRNGVQTKLTNDQGNNFSADWRAVHTTIGGRVLTPNGTGLRSAVVTINGPDGYRQTFVTNPLGYYSFNGVMVGRSYTINVHSKRYRFASRTLELNESLIDIDFIALE